MESIKTAGQLSGQNAIHIAFSQLPGTQHLTTITLKTRRPKINTPDVSCITEFESMKKTDPCDKSRGPHFQHDCTSNISNDFKAKMPTYQTHRRNTYTVNFTTIKSTTCFQWEPFQLGIPTNSTR